MNRAEYESMSNRIAAVEVRCELLEAENAKLRAESLDKMVDMEQDRVTKKAEKRAGSF